MAGSTDYRTHNHTVAAAGPTQSCRIESRLHSDTQRRVESSSVLQSLTDREIQCLCWCADGKTYWESGVILGISERTVSFHMETVRSKLRATTNAHAVTLAFKAGLLALSRREVPEVSGCARLCHPGSLSAA
jgi:DNA-binding CsgD family transcriptional regulator